MPDGFSTDSYPKAPSMPVSPLDIAIKMGQAQQQAALMPGQLQQQQLQISQAQLDQANQGFNYLTRAMSSLGPNATKEQYKSVGQNAVDLGLVPQNMLHVWDQRVDAAPDSPTFFKQTLGAVADHQQQLALQTGANTTQEDGKYTIPGKTNVLSGAFTPAGQPIPRQLPVGTVGYDQNNQQQFEQPAAPSIVGPSGAVVAPQARRMPVAPPTPAVSGPTGPSVETTGGPNSPPATFAQRADAAFPKPLSAGPSPLFGEGKEAYTKDQLAASGKAQAIKPAVQALKLMHGISTGPGTEQLNTLAATAKALGIVGINEADDPTVKRQEINKKLAQYISSSPIGQRSDAAQALSEASSPSAKTQILPALQNLTRDAIALDRVNILKPQAFQGTDYQNYIKHQGTFPQNIDEKALTLDLLPEKERNSLVTKMVSQYKNGNAGEKQIANKFLDTLKLAKEHGVYEGM